MGERFKDNCLRANNQEKLNHWLPEKTPPLTPETVSADSSARKIRQRGPEKGMRGKRVFFAEHEAQDVLA